MVYKKIGRWDCRSEPCRWEDFKVERCGQEEINKMIKLRRNASTSQTIVMVTYGLHFVILLNIICSLMLSAWVARKKIDLKNEKMKKKSKKGKNKLKDTDIR